ILYGDTTFTSGKLGQAGSFDGTGDYVSVADSTSLRITSGGLTLSGWMTMNNFTNGSMIFYKGEIANGNAGNYNFRVNSDRTIDFLFYDGVGVNKYWRSTSAVYPNDSNYHFISLSHQWGNGSSTKIYVDGVQVSGSWVSGTGNETPLANTDILTIGVQAINKSGGAVNYHNGKYDDVRIYNRALSAVEIENLYRTTSNEVVNETDAVVDTSTDNTFDGTSSIQRDTTVTAGLVGWWAMDEASGSYAYDRSGNGNTGTDTGGSSIVTGKLGRARSFDLGTNYIVLPSSTDFDFGTGAFSISGWVKADSLTNMITLFKKKTGNWGNANTTGYMLSVLPDGRVDLRVTDDPLVQDLLTSTGLIKVGNWYHITAVRDGASSKIFVNGIDGTATNGIDGTANTDITAQAIINHGGHVSYIGDGTLDDIRVYSRALSPSEIQTIYAEGQKAITGSVSVSADVKPS
ncbi:hypothetical protein COY32_07020, partial [candidate division WWE3 bacterium CG_4_10_14_0_2_um_filter_41_14]